MVFNEILAHTDDPVRDFIELYNHSNDPADVSGCLLTDRRGGLVDGSEPSVFRIPAGTVIPARGHLSFDQEELGFSLSAAGETIYLANSTGTRVLDAVGFEGQANGVSSGRFPDGGPEFYPLTSPTPGLANGDLRVGAVVINEIMYAPVSGSQDDEYVELYNWSAQPVDVGGWRLADGIEFEIPAGTVIPAGGFLVAARNRDQLLARYDGVLTPSNTVGNYIGALSNSGERVRLSRPEQLLSTNSLGEIESTISWILADEVAFRDGGRWGQWSDGGGSSLEKSDPRGDGRQPDSWADSDESAKAPGPPWSSAVGSTTGT